MINVIDIAYVRYQAPDLERMRRFMVDFGLQTIRQTETALYMRGVGSQPFVHVTEQGETAAALGFGFLAASADDLHRLAEACDVAVLDNTEPGGGKVVSVRDPQGLRIDVIHGFTPEIPASVREPLKINPALGRARFGTTQRVPAGSSHIMRLGHVALFVPDLQASVDFYSRHFGLYATDSYYAGQPNNVVGRFLRCGLGKNFTDHHTLALISNPRGGFEHTGFEVLDWDDLVVGNAHLKSGGYKHSWGIGRHVEGSQVFDYWRDPFGNKVEHWTDGDLINEDYVPGSQLLSPAALAQWGPPMTDDFMS